MSIIRGRKSSSDLNADTPERAKAARLTEDEMKEKQKKTKELSAWFFAHRGLHSKPEIPENSMAAFRRAVEQGFGIELDVHLTKDGRLAVIHDSNLQRTTGQDLIVEELTLEEAKQYNLEESTERICELSEVLEMNGGKTPFVIELKAHGKNEAELTDRVMETLEGYEGLYCIESFNPLAVKHLRLYYPGVIRGQLAGDLLKPAEDTNGAKPEETDENEGEVHEKKPTRRKLKKIKKAQRKEAKSHAGVNEIQNIMMTQLMVNWWGRPDFVSYHYADINNRAFRNFKGAKFAWTIKNFEEMKDCYVKGIAPIFEQFNPKDYL